MLIEIILAGLVAMAIVAPVACLFDKWNKEMKADEQKNSERDS